MGFVTTIGGLPITGPLFGLEWLARRIAEAAERELNDPTRVERELITLERALDAGEIDEATFEAREAELLTELAEIMHARARPGEATPLSDPDTDMAQETGAATLPPDGTGAAA